MGKINSLQQISIYKAKATSTPSYESRRKLKNATLKTYSLHVLLVVILLKKRALIKALSHKAKKYLH